MAFKRTRVPSAVGEPKVRWSLLPLPNCVFSCSVAKVVVPGKYRATTRDDGQRAGDVGGKAGAVAVVSHHAQIDLAGTLAIVP